MENSEAHLRRADEEGDAAAATQIGVLLQVKGDRSGALAAFQRADERGDALGAYHLGVLLVELDGNTDDAIRTLVRAEKRGHGPATSALDSMVPPLPGEHPISLKNRRDRCGGFDPVQTTPQAGFEPATIGLEGRCSVH